jgi:hypothetical protein
MRECPNCGYINPPYWRNVRFRIFTSCCHLEDFKQLKPALAERITTEIDLIEDHYIYHLVKKANIVQRIHITDSIDGKSWREPEQEKHFKFVVPEQQKLLACERCK